MDPTTRRLVVHCQLRHAHRRSACGPVGCLPGSIEERLAVIGANHAQWIVSKVFDAMALVLVSAGGLVFAAALRQRDWLGIVGGTSFGVTGIVGLFHVYRLATDPGPVYEGDVPVPLVTLVVLLTGVALLFLSPPYSPLGLSAMGGMGRSGLGDRSSGGSGFDPDPPARSRAGIHGGGRRFRGHPLHRDHARPAPEVVHREFIGVSGSSW